MKKENLQIWIKLRAEVIKHFHDTENKDKFIGGYPLDFAKLLAEHEVGVYEIPILSLDEMLLLSLDECVELSVERTFEKKKELIKYLSSL